MAIEALPDVFKSVVLMFYFDDCSYKEIAQRTNLPLRTVMIRHSRAKNHLQGRLFELEGRDQAAVTQTPVVPSELLHPATELLHPARGSDTDGPSVTPHSEILER